MRTSTGLRSKIWVAFILQVAAISFATVLGVYGASAVLKDVLIQRALTSEAGHYWKRLERDPGAELPDTYNMRGYLTRDASAAESLPAYLRALAPGYHSLPKLEGGALVYVSDGPPGRLYLEFNQEQVDALAFFFGAVPLVVVLVVIYAIAWITYRVSRRAVSPVIWLSNIVQHWDPKRPDAASLSPERLPGDVEGEVRVLAAALHDFATRIEAFVERERDFTRDASHELRTPLTVIRMASELMSTDAALPTRATRSLARIQSATRDMEALIESFLILAREGDTGLPQEDFPVLDVVEDEIEKARPLLLQKPIEMVLEAPRPFALHASPRVLSVMLGNLLRNACHYTEQGRIVVRIEGDRIEVEDSGVGMTPDELERAFEPFYRAGARREGGQGVGLTIVRRLSQRFGWPVELHSEAGRGTRATIRFPHPLSL
jgi:signal transduction histidine kinase